MSDSIHLPNRRFTVPLILLLGLCVCPTLGAEPPPSSPKAQEPIAEQPTLLRETQEAEYLNVVHSQFHSRWSTFLKELGRMDSRYQDKSLRTSLIFALGVDGHIDSQEQPEKTGLAGFDSAAVDVLKDIGRFAPPPSELTSDDGRVYIRIVLARKEPGCEEVELVERRLPLPQALPRLLSKGRVVTAIERFKEEPLDRATRKAVLRTLVVGIGRIGAKSKDPMERATAAAILRYVEDAEAPLLTLLADGDVEVRKAALAALGDRPLSSAAIPVLKGALKNEGKAGASMLLSRLKDQSGVLALREALTQGENPQEMVTALRALGDQEELTKIVVGMLGKDESRLAGALAAHTLADPQLTPMILLALRMPLAKEETRIALLDAIGVLGERTSPDARKGVAALLKDPQAAIRAASAKVSAGMGDRSPGLRYRLIDLLVDPSPKVRAAAGAALVVAFGEPAKDEIIRAARDKNLDVRIAVAQAILAHPYPSAPVLYAKLQKDAALVKAVPELAAPLPASSSKVAVAGAANPPLLQTPPATPDEEVVLVEQIVVARDSASRLRAAAAWIARQPVIPWAER